jgi:hypothetical protein
MAWAIRNSTCRSDPRILGMAQPFTLARSRCADRIVIFRPVASFTN